MNLPTIYSLDSQSSSCTYTGTLIINYCTFFELLLITDLTVE